MKLFLGALPSVHLAILCGSLILSVLPAQVLILILEETLSFLVEVKHRAAT